MKKKVFIHLGVPKTGSTLLQSKLFPIIQDIKYIGRSYDNSDSSPLFEKIDRFVELGENDNAQSLNEIHKLLTNLLDQNNKILISNENWLQPTNVDKDTHKIFISNFWEKLKRLNKIFHQLDAQIFYFAVKRDQTEAVPSFFSTVHYRITKIFGFKMNDINFFVENMIKNKDGNNKISLFYEMYDYSKISNFISKNFSNKITYFEFNELKNNKENFIKSLIKYFDIKENENYFSIMKKEVRVTPKVEGHYTSQVQFSQKNIFFNFLSKACPSFLKRFFLLVFKFSSFYPSFKTVNKISKESLELIKNNYPKY